jgi:hypothetical protein
MDHQPFMIFIAGVPSVSTKHELMEFFQSFGPIKSIQPRLCQTELSRQNSAEALPKVYWLLEAADMTSYKSILAVEPCIFRGRKLYLAPFKSGTALIMHNNSIARRRALIKRVPSWLSEHALINLIERGFGPIFTYFRYQSDKSEFGSIRPTSRIRKFFTYSVTFENKSDRDDIVNAGCIQIAQDVLVTVEKFVHKNAKKKKKLSKKSKPNVALAFADTDPQQALDSESALEYQKHLSAKQTRELSFDTLQADWYSSWLDEGNEIGDLIRFDLPSPRPYPKPTQREYHLMKPNQVTNTNYVGNKKNPIEDENLRFNIVELPVSKNGSLIQEPPRLL